MSTESFSKGSVEKLALRAKSSSRVLARASSSAKNKALLGMAEALREKQEYIIAENEKDLVKGRVKLSPAMLDRLTLTPGRINDMADGLCEIAALKDPVGEVLGMEKRPSGLSVGKMRVPLGVVGIIYESRPNVTADASGLCIKSGNAVILRGGSEAFYSNMAVASVLTDAIESAGLPGDVLQYISFTDRAAIDELLILDELIDVIIPRGGEGLIRAVVEKSRIPVIKHYKGVCHTFVDDSANLDMAVAIAFNAKTHRPGVCNAMETLLVHRNIASAYLPLIAAKYKEAGVEIRGCKETAEIIADAKPACEDDWYAEYLELIIAIRVVSDIDEAMDHIAKYGSMHSEAIVTENYERAQRFIAEVDSASVFVNASTRFSDGNQFGLGAEIGISTQKLHARGPMGIQELTSTKFIVYGSGQVRE